MKKGSAILFLTLLGIQLLLLPLLFLSMNELLGLDAGTKLKKQKHLHDLYIPEAEWKLVNRLKSDEIQFKGEFYDVKSIRISKEGMVLCVYHDIKEKKLFDSFAHLKKKETSHHSCLYGFVFSLLNYEKPEEDQLLPLTCQCIRWQIRCTPGANAAHLNRFSPPPEFSTDVRPDFISG